MERDSARLMVLVHSSNLFANTQQAGEFMLTGKDAS